MLTLKALHVADFAHDVVTIPSSECHNSARKSGRASCDVIFFIEDDRERVGVTHASHTWCRKRAREI